MLSLLPPLPFFRFSFSSPPLSFPPSFPLSLPPLTVCLYSPTSDGSACAIVCSEDFVKANGLEDKAVEILAIEMATDLPSTFNKQSCMKMVRFGGSYLV